MTGYAKIEVVRRRGAKAYLGAAIVAQFCALARYTLLARFLGPEQLGVAVALILTSQFFESITESGSDRFLVQDSHGDEPGVQRLVQLVWMTRGLVIGAFLIVLAVPLANFYGAPQLADAFPVLALAPIIAGFTHLDFRRLQRRSDYHGESRVLVVSEAVSLLVTGIAAFVTRDFTAILYGLTARAIMVASVSQLVAERPYSIGFTKDHARRLAAFSIPLMMNGILLFLGSQGDRLLIGKQVGLKELGYYSAAILLIFYPSGVITRYIHGMHLPRLAPHGDTDNAAAVDRFGSQSLLISVVMLVGYTVAAPIVIPLAFGQAFALPVGTIAAIGSLQALRFIRVWPMTSALARGRSDVVLMSNCFRLCAFPLALIAERLFGGFYSIVIAFAVSELASLFGTVIIVNRTLTFPNGFGLDRVVRLGLLCATVVWGATLYDQGRWAQFSLAGAGTLLLLTWTALREQPTIREALAFTMQIIRRADG